MANTLINIIKATHIVAAKISMYLENNLATTINGLVINKLVKLTMLWTTEPWVLNMILKYLFT